MISATSNDVRVGRAVGRGGFSLVELLTVLAIIALLLALLFPALKGARAKAQAAACTSNLGQISVAMHAWMGDHNGNFLGPFCDTTWSLDANGGMNGYGGGSLCWWNMLGRFNYIGKPVKIHYPNTAQGTYGVHDQWKYPLLRCPGEPEWTTMPAQYTAPSGPYMGAPYTAWLHAYLGTSYGMSWYISQITCCSCDKGATPPVSANCYCCSRTYCGFGTNVFENMCCARGFQSLKAGVEPARALVIMDYRIPQYPWWQDGMFFPDLLGLTDWAAGANTVHMTDPALLHAYRHNGRAHGIFHDGHVEGFRPMEYVPAHQRVRLDLWEVQY